MSVQNRVRELEKVWLFLICIFELFTAKKFVTDIPTWATFHKYAVVNLSYYMFKFFWSIVAHLKWLSILSLIHAI